MSPPPPTGTPASDSQQATSNDYFDVTPCTLPPPEGIAPEPPTQTVLSDDLSAYLNDSDEDEILPEEVIGRIKVEFRRKNRTAFLPANIRNILFCGATRSGKTTTFKVFQDPVYVPETSSIFSETQDTTFKSFALRDANTGRIHDFVVNLVDSPGIFEMRAADDKFEERSTEEISSLIVKCLENEITYLNMVVLFLPLGTVAQKDVDAIDYFSRMFTGCGLPIVLCITHADMFTKGKRTEYEQQLHRHPRLAKYFSEKLLRVMFMGCVDHRHMSYPCEKSMKRMYAQVMTWRQAFLDEIFHADTRVDLINTNIYKDKAQNAKQLLFECVETLQRLKEMDKEVATYKDAVMAHGTKMELLFKDKTLLSNEPDVAEKRAQFIELIQSVRGSRVSDFVKKELISPWRI